MPIFFQQDIDEATKLAIWKIGEEEAFFLEKVPLQRSITHPHKRLQHLAGRYLLQYLFPDFPIHLIQIADTRKPYLEDEAYHFSISHCDDYAAVLVSKNKRVGVDIEVISSKVERIRDKFSTLEERALMEHVKWKMENGTAAGLTLIWSCKEAVFKWYGLGEVDFKKHIRLMSITPGNEGITDVIVDFTKDRPITLRLTSFCFDGLYLSYIYT